MANKVFQIALIRFSSFGDVFLASSVVQFLRSQYGHDVRLTWITEDRYVTFIKSIASVDEVISFPKTTIFSFAASVFKNHSSTLTYDLIWDLHASQKSLVFRLCHWKSPSIVVNKRKWERFLLRFFKNDSFFEKPSHHLKRLMQDFSPLWHLSIPNAFYPTFEPWDKLELNNTGVFVPHAAHGLKEWPKEYYEKLMLLLHQSRPLEEAFVVVLGPGEKWTQDLALFKGRNMRCLFSTSMEESMRAVASARYVVTSDTGPMHATWLTQNYCFAFFGPTSEHYGFAPYHEKVFILSEKLNCRPCSITGSGLCSLKDVKSCLTKITPEKVAAYIAEKVL
jgi:ADP-heptose:LPS heptosyltransferase